MINTLIAFERKIADLWEAGKIRGPIHLSGGNEKELIEMSKELKNSQNGNQNFSELENIEDLKIPFPYNMNEWDSIDYINDVLKKHMKNKKKYNK